MEILLVNFAGLFLCLKINCMLYVCRVADTNCIPCANVHGVNMV